MNPVKSKSIYKSISIIILLALSIIPATLLTTTVKAQGTITLSSGNLHPTKAIEIRVDIPGLTANEITLRVLDPAGNAIIPNLIARSVATGVYYAYLGGEDIQNLAEFLGAGAKVDPSQYGAMIPRGRVSLGTTLTIEVLGYGISTTVYYGYVAPTSVKFDRDVVPTRRINEYEITLTVVDQDLNLNPVAVDQGGNIILNLRLIGTADGFYAEGQLQLQVGSESKVNSAEFSVRFTVQDLIDVLQGIEDREGGPLKKGDVILIDVASDVGGNDNTKTISTKITADYRYPTVKVSFTQQGITIDVESPDDNVRSRAPDTLQSVDEQGNNIYVYVSFAGRTCNVPANLFQETGSNTNVFRLTIPVAWGQQNAIDCDNLRVTLGVDKASFTLSATYLDRTGSGTYETAKPEVTVQKQSPVNVILLVNDRDINVNPNSIDRLNSRVAGGVIYLYTTDGVNIVDIYEISVYDDKGNFVRAPADINVAFFETDFNSGVFRLIISSPGLFTAGKSYTIKIKDHTGGYTVDVPVTITPVEIKLDRSEYPATPGGLTIYITYSNDLYNIRPERIDYIDDTVVVEIRDANNNQLQQWVVQRLTETDVDSGVFTGSITINIPLDDRVIEGKIVVYDPNYREVAKAEAKLKIFDGSLKVEPSTVKMGDTITITIEDQDLNRDSQRAEEYNLQILSSARCGAMAVRLKETGPNTGVFTATLRVSLEDMPAAFADCLRAPDTFTITYSDVRERELIEGYTRYTMSLQAKVSLVSTTGTLDVKTAEEGYIGLDETFTVTVKDVDLNLRAEQADRATVYIVVEGIRDLEIRPYEVQLDETGSSTGVFTVQIRFRDIPGVPGDLTQRASLVGKKVMIMYRDEADATGVARVVQKILTIKAYEPYITVSPKDFVNVGEDIFINVTDKNRAGARTVDVIVKSTNYPMPITLRAYEVGENTGVFTTKVKVVDPSEWIFGAPQVPALLGDTITITYIAPVNSAGQTNVPVTTSLVVGRYAPIPAKTEKVETLDEYGKPVTPSVGKLTFVSVTVKNVDIVSRDMTVMVVVRDPDGVAVAMFFTTLTLSPGESRAQGFGFIPAKAGTYSVEVYVVKSLADRTVLAEPYSTSLNVV
ncbi:hypothetical protein Igag_0041 [Ignisphaera aggregans DSM 17230]|uniref:Uncharacterized protein n=1 Tax=Ignisphaera aggregans (strain DSM 17230 / JCM 13409 / AQ1.S1) TaxID=583356 RepID=E0SPF1_IGNAA|nr:hypothetical protein Igag_0041 [Ignisphaera aggregans DSM 17230]